MFPTDGLFPTIMIYELCIMNLFHVLGAKNVRFVTLFAPKM